MSIFGCLDLQVALLYYKALCSCFDDADVHATMKIRDWGTAKTVTSFYGVCLVSCQILLYIFI